MHFINLFIKHKLFSLISDFRIRERRVKDRDIDMQCIADFLTRISDEISDMQKDSENSEIAYHDFADALGKDLLRKIFPHYDWSHLDINEDEEADQPVVPDEVLMSEDPNVTYHRSRFHGVSCMYAVADGHAFVFVADNDHGPVMERRAMLSWGSHALRLKRTIAILRAKIASSPIPDAGASQAKVRPCEKTPASSDS